VLAAVLITAVTDLWRFKVHNVVTLPLLASGLIYHAAVGGWSGLGISAWGAVFAFGALFVLYVVGGMGGGDVKLFAGVGAWLGLPLTFQVLLATSLAAGVYALALILLFRTHGETWANLQILWLRFRAIGRYLGAEEKVEAAVGRTDARRRLIPFAAMIAIGTIATLLWIWLRGSP
jgi:prepilin peptidase CpaA